jgi:hypothetical protein
MKFGAICTRSSQVNKTTNFKPFSFLFFCYQAAEMLKKQGLSIDTIVLQV